MWAMTKHLRVSHGNNEFSPEAAFTSTASRAFGVTPSAAWRYSNGVPKHTFYLHLKNTEFRFNHRHESVYQALLSLLRTTSL